MSKIITDTEILGVLTASIANYQEAHWAVSPLSTEAAYQHFLDDIGKLIARHFGGRFNQVAKPEGIENLGYTLSFAWDHRIPPDGGIYLNLDTDLPTHSWRKEKPKLSELGQLI